MEIIETSLKDAFLIKPQVFQDERGFFLESYSKKFLEEKGLKADFVQDNHSYSAKKGTLRGLHFQLPPSEQAKLIRVIRGSIYDVVIDLRKNSPTYLKSENFGLSASNFHMLFVPRGFAHGFMALEDNTEIIYKVDNYYSQEHDSGIVWNDPDLDISWPMKNPIHSEKDAKLQFFKDFKSKNPF